MWRSVVCRAGKMRGAARARLIGGGRALMRALGFYPSLGRGGGHSHDLVPINRAAPPPMRAAAPDGNITLAPMVSVDQMRQAAISVCFVLPIVADDRAALARSVQSLLRQTEASWELLLVPAPGCEALAEEWLDIDWRIRRAEGLDVASALIAAARFATCDFMGLLGQGDVADDDLLAMLVDTAGGDPEVDLIYTDEARLDEDGRIGEPFYKPDWSPAHLGAVNYVGRFAAIRKRLLLNARRPQGLSAAALEYGTILDASRAARKIVHVDRALYSRSGPVAAAPGGFFPPEARGEARALAEAHARRDDPGARVVSDDSGALRTIWPVPEGTPITLVILTGLAERDLAGRGRVVLVTHFVRSIIETSRFAGYRIMVVDDGMLPRDLCDLLDAHGHERRSHHRDGAFSFVEKANFAVEQAPDGVVILLNDDLEVISPDWIERLAGWAARPQVGVVGARLLFPEGAIQHAGVTLGFHDLCGHIFYRQVPEDGGYAGFASLQRNYSAVTGAVMAFRRSVFMELGGFDPQLSIDFNDIDFCLRAMTAGYQVVYEPAATLYHFENSSLQRRDSVAAERDLFRVRWRALIDRDPFFNRNFQKYSHELPLLIEAL